MVKKAIWVLSVLVVAAISASIVLRNSSQLTVRLAPDWEVTANAGVIILSVFLFGVLCTCVVWSYFGFKSYLREKQRQRRERRRQKVYELLRRGRALLAAGDWNKACAAWEQLLRQDSTDVIARVELSRCQQGAGDLRAALKTIESARALDPGNLEVLFRAAELSLALGNKTGAIDSLALILYSNPTEKAARWARDLSEELGRIDDAIEYQEKLENLGVNDPDVQAASTRLQFKRIIAGEGPATEQGSLRNALKAFLKRHPEYTPALEKLASLEAAEGRIDDAAQLLADAAKHSGSAEYWQRASDLWINHRMAGRAVAAARAAAAGSQGSRRLDAELFLVRLYLSLGMLDQAEEILTAFPDRAREQGVAVEGALEQRWFVLQGMCAHLLGRYPQAAEIWRKLAGAALQGSALPSIAYPPARSANE